MMGTRRKFSVTLSDILFYVVFLQSNKNTNTLNE